MAQDYAISQLFNGDLRDMGYEFSEPPPVEPTEPEPAAPPVDPLQRDKAELEAFAAQYPGILAKPEAPKPDPYAERRAAWQKETEDLKALADRREAALEKAEKDERRAKAERDAERFRAGKKVR